MLPLRRHQGAPHHLRDVRLLPRETGGRDRGSLSWRRKRGSSIEVATRLVKDGQAFAVVGAGNTGACVAASTLLLGVLPNVKKAGIAVAFTTGETRVVVIDVGANVYSKPEHLIQYGVMASLYAREILGVEQPRVGLLNIGEEDEKGNLL